MFDDDEPTLMVPTFGPGAFFADRYRIEQLLGSGAMGRVYAAAELRSDRRVALKVLHRERLGEAETLARFSREAEVLASIGHPCIVEIHAFHHTSDGIPYLAMELLEGVTLKTRLTNAGRFEDPRDFQQIVDCVAGALSAAHERGVVHRDMKPDNVFLPATGEPRAKLVDFGLSRMAVQKKNLTQRGMILGTPRYMAPEQIRNAAAAGPGVDIYSAGVLMYESLSGQSPYPAQDYGQLLGCVIEGRVLPLEGARPDLPSRIGDVVRRAMHPDPAQRFGTAGELADAYAEAIGSPSRRREITAAGRARAERRPWRVTSNQSLVVNKGSTLAFDAAAAFGGELPDLREAASILAAPTEPAPRVGGETAPPSEAPPASPPLKAQGGDTLFIPSLHGGPPPPALHAPAPPYAPPPASAFSSHAPAPLPAPTTPTRSRRGVVLFLVALVLVVVLSAAAGFGLRAYQRGELTLPGALAR